MCMRSRVRSRDSVRVSVCRICVSVTHPCADVDVNDTFTVNVKVTVQVNQHE